MGPIQVTPPDGAFPKTPIEQVVLWNFGRPHRDGSSSDAMAHASSASRIGHTVKLSKIANKFRLRKVIFLVTEKWVCGMDKLIQVGVWKARSEQRKADVCTSEHEYGHRRH